MCGVYVGLCGTLNDTSYIVEESVLERLLYEVVFQIASAEMRRMSADQEYMTSAKHLDG